MVRNANFKYTGITVICQRRLGTIDVINEQTNGAS